MHEALHAGREGGLAGVDRHLVVGELVGRAVEEVVHPGGGVDHHVHALHHRVGLPPAEQVGRGDVTGQAFDVAEVRVRQVGGAHVVTFACELVDYVRRDEPAGPCHKNGVRHGDHSFDGCAAGSWPR